MERIRYVVNVLIIVLMFAAVAVQRDGRMFGIDVKEMMSEGEEEVIVETQEQDGTRVINSTSIAKDVIGFSGATPIKLYIKEGIVTKVEYLANAETPSFFEEVEKANLKQYWEGKSVSDVANKEIDAVSGATYSSQAISENVRKAAQYAGNVDGTSRTMFSSLGLKEIVGLLVILLGAVISLMKIRDKRLIIVQQVLNVVVLGFWIGSFLSLTTFTNWAANGFNWSLSLVTIVMFLVILVMPLFNKKGTYCHIHCPMGSAQGLLENIPGRKIKLSPAVNKFLNNLRYYLLASIMLLMWLGVGFDIMNYEVFSAFIFESASVVVLVIAIVFLLLSVFISHPYCRFVCPTGALLTMSANTKE